MIAKPKDEEWLQWFERPAPRFNAQLVVALISAIRDSAALGESVQFVLDNEVHYVKVESTAPHFRWTREHLH